MTTEPEIIAPTIKGPKPIAVVISGMDVAKLAEANCSVYEYNQLILAKLKDAGAPVEGMISLKMANGSVFKMKTNPMVEEQGFTYIWLPPAYVEGINALGGVQGAQVPVNA